MGTNRRSRRRSAARILNPNTNQKRSRLSTSDYLDESNHETFPSVDDDSSNNGLHQCSSDVLNLDSNINSSPREDLSGDTVMPSGDAIFPGISAHSDSTPSPPIFSMSEVCSYELMTLLDNAGCPLNTYERVVALLKKQEKRGFSYSKAHSRDKLLKLLRQKFHCPSIQSSIINSCEVFAFPFLDMLQDLIVAAGTSLHRITPSNIDDEQFHDELWNTEWMQQTFLSPLHDSFDESTDIMLPLIIFLDKTGTDVLQRYSLEPLLFTTIALKRETRENRQYWRHLGFIPSSKCVEDSKESLRFYHQCLTFLLDGIRQAQINRPLIQVKNPDGSFSHLRVHVPLMIVMGDQLSQDTLCCRRKANAGGAGRVHRSCMCSYLQSDDPLHKCTPVPKKIIDDILVVCNRTNDDVAEIIDKEDLIHNKSAASSSTSRTMKYFSRQKKLFTTILGKPFTMHPVVSAFHDLDFGAWTNGIYDATFDDFMHSFEEGMMENIGATLFDGLVPSEAETVESIMIPLLNSIHSSARSTFPRWRLQKGFSRQTLMTMGERVGSVFSLALGLHNPELARVFHNGHERQRGKYQLFATSQEECPLYYEQYLHPMSLEDCRHTLIHLIRHGFDVSLLEILDPFQINQLLYHAFAIVEKAVYPDSYPEFSRVGQLYIDMGNKVIIEQRLMTLVAASVNVAPSNMFRKHRLISIDGVIAKHHKRKEKQKGDGSTCAYLGESIHSLILFLEYTLTYHAFCKYSSSLPPRLTSDFHLIDYSGRSLLTYFSKMIYRGDGTIDSRTTKVHAQRRFGSNFRSLGNVMHSCCEVGERLLKTEAKKISRTAQQRGCTIFERQTCSRILDRHLLDKMGLALSGTQLLDNKQGDRLNNCTSSSNNDTFSRHQPHYIVCRDPSSVFSCDRKGNRQIQGNMTGILHQVVVNKLLELLPESNCIEVYCEVILRDGSYIRAFPKYHGVGPWYDFVNIQWEDATGAPYLLPAQCLAFYQKEGECMAIVQSVDQESMGKLSHYKNSVLTTHYKMQCTRSGAPILYGVNCASIDSPVMAIDHSPGFRILDDAGRRSVMIVRPRNEWAYAWYVWNQHLKIKNTNRTMSRPYVDLGTELMVSKVRQLTTECLVQHGKA